MRSRISLFNWGLARNLLKRFWPLWTGYALILLLGLPTTLPRFVQVSSPYTATDAQMLVGVNAMSLLFWSAIAGIVLARAMYGHLFNARLSGLVNSLPLRRETVFCTAYFTGLAPLLVADLLTALFVGLIALPGGFVSVDLLLRWLAMAVLANFTFYSFAVFCATLVGNRVFLPLLFVMLNVIVGLLVLCVEYLLDLSVCGYAMDFPDWALFLTPPAKLVSAYADSWLGLDRNFDSLIGLGPIAIYAGLSLLFLLAGFLLYRRRHMEKVGDAIAVPWLKPILQVLFTLGFALVFALLLLGLTGADSATLSKPLLLAFLLVGCFLGYFLSEMMQRRTVRVFCGTWRGFFALAALLTVFVLVLSFDLFGFGYAPEPDQVRSVSLSGEYEGHLEEPENVAAAVALHREVLALYQEERGFVEQRYGSIRKTLMIRYELKSGRTVTREYAVPIKVAQEAARLCDTPDSLCYHLERSAGISRENVREASLRVTSGAGDNKTTTEYSLTVDELMALMEQGVLPDARLGQIDLQSNGAFRGVPVYTVYVDLKQRNEHGTGLISIEVDAVSDNTRAWIEDYLQANALTGESVTER